MTLFSRNGLVCLSHEKEITNSSKASITFLAYLA